MEKSKGKLNRIKRAGVILAVVCLIYVVLSVAASAVVYKMIFVYAADEKFNPSYRYADVADELPREEVDFPRGDRTLHGYYYKAKGTARGVIVVACGIGRNGDAHLAETVCFTDNGWDVFAYDGTGLGKSGGDSVIGLSQARVDLIAAIDWVSEAHAGLPQVVYGHSAGAYAAAAALADRDVAAAICISAFDTPVEEMHLVARRYVGFLADVELPFLRLQNWLTFGDGGSISASETINSVDTPVLIWYGADDDIIPAEASVISRSETISNPNAEFVRADDGGHSDAWLSDTAAAYTTQIMARYNAMADEYGGDVPDQVMSDFTDAIDYDRANELDIEFMYAVLDFCGSAIDQRR